MVVSVLVKVGEFRKVWGYKYVRFADGEVLFCDGGDINSSHSQIVEERNALPGKIVMGRPVDGAPVPPPVSAGMIKVRNGEWYVCEGGSMSTGLRRFQSDEKYIGRELGAGYRHNPEMTC